jgi:glycerol-3-phosphate dehydrogenase
MRLPLDQLHGRAFDVIIIGAGVNGASACQHLAAAGYSVLLVDKGDFASGASGRSSRVLHCGLRYLAPGGSMWDFVLHPGRLAAAMRMASLAMQAREQMVRTAPEHVFATKCHFPIYRDGAYAAWQVRLALNTLSVLGSRRLPLQQHVLRPDEAKNLPLVRWLRDPDRLVGIAAYREYQFDWPERICLDAVLDAERLGATVRNYTEAVKLVRGRGEVWGVQLIDRFDPRRKATVRAKVVLNTAGVWIDRVNASAEGRARRRITGTKGCHILVQLPPECREYGIATLNRVREPFYCLPWRGFHYFGPTETLYNGDPDDVRTNDDEVDFLLGEANYLLPALSLSRGNVLHSWAGVRPLTFDPRLAKGSRTRTIHDLAADGMPNLLAMTAGPVMTHRSAGVELTQAVAKRIAPSGRRQSLSYAARRFPENQDSPSLLEDDTTVKLSDLRHAAEHEHAISLVDLLVRRTGVAFSETMGYFAAQRAAESVADLLGWDSARIEAEIKNYHAYLALVHGYRPTAA